MNNHIKRILTESPIAASAPCRVDLGGTLDISTFYNPLHYLDPSTFNIAIDMRTRVRISPHTPGVIRISSRGFESAEYPIDAVPFAHPMGLMFAVASFFQIDGIHVEIASSSPPRSALGGSSSAAVAMIAACSELLRKTGRPGIPMDRIADLAHDIEQSVAGVPCGIQDHLAAVFGGANAWRWKGRGSWPWYERQSLINASETDWIDSRMLVAYGGEPHESKDVNGVWVRRFIDGTHRTEWIEIVQCTNRFIAAFLEKNTGSAVRWMQRETEIRREMTPQVLDEMGEQLVAAAIEASCGARFTGAGGGGCIWAFGEPADIAALRSKWPRVLSAHTDAVLLDVSVDTRGLELE